MTVSLLITDRNLVTVGDPIGGWTDLEVVGRFNEPASGTFRIPAWPGVVDTVRRPGNRVVVIRDGAVFTAGPIEKPGPDSWDAGEGGPGQLSVSFADDSALIAGRISFPNPAAAATAQTTVDAWIRTGINAEAVMRAAVNLNAGPGALVSRRIPRLILGSVAGVGGNVTITSRFEPLGDLLRRVAIAGGALGYRTRQSGTNILFEVYAPTDKTGSVRFSRGLGNLRSVSYEPEAPTVTTAIVAGGGEGTARVVREVTDSAAAADWWRLEKFVDQRQTTDTAELDAAGAEALADGGEQSKLTTVTVDTDTQRYGVHYELGDKVAVELISGVQINDVVRGIQLQASAAEGSEVLTAVIGSQDASRDPAWIRIGRDYARRISQLERR